MTPLILVGLLTCPVAAAGPGLGAGVPSDVDLYVHWQSSPGGSTKDLGDRLRSAIRGSEIFREVAGKIVEKVVVGSGARAMADDDIDSIRSRWLGLLGKVDWLEILSTEAVLALRIEDGTPEALVLFRLAPGRELETAEALRRICYAVCSTTPELEIIEDWRDQDRTLVLTGVSTEIAPAFAVRGDVLIASTSPFLLRRSMQLLSGDGSDLGYALTDARREALAGLPAPDPAADARLEVHASTALALVAWTTAGEIRYAFRLSPSSPAPPVAEPSGIESLWSAVPEGVERFELSAGVRPEAFLPTLGAVRDPLGAGLDRARRTGLVGERWVGRVLEAVDRLAEASPLLTGRRVVLESADGACILLELSRAESVASRLEDLLERVEKDIGARTIEPGPEGLRWLEVPGVELGRSRGETRKVLAGVAGGRLVLGTSGELVVRALAGKGTDLRRSPRDLVGTWIGDVGPGQIEAMRVLDRPWAIEALRVGAGFLSALGSGRDGVVEALPRLAPILDALDTLGEERSVVVRDGASVRGFGEIRIGAARKPSERRL